MRDRDRRGISHQSCIPFSAMGSWEDVTVNIEDLEPTFFGRRVSGRPLDILSAREIGIILSDGVDGAFSLEIDSIRLCQ